MNDTEYIQRDAVDNVLLELEDRVINNPFALTAMAMAIDKIDNIPAAAVAPVEHAQWIQANDIDETAWRCSKCDLTWILDEGTPSENEMRYCPKCGAYMIESEERTNE